MYTYEIYSMSALHSVKKVTHKGLQKPTSDEIQDYT